MTTTNAIITLSDQKAGSDARLCQLTTMKISNYLLERQSLVANIANLDTITSLTWNRRYMRFAANLKLALPGLTDSQLLEQFKRTVLNRQLSFLDERFSTVVPCGWKNGDDTVVAELRRHPAVVGTFHTGSYRLLVHQLIRQHVPVALLISRAVRQKQESHYRVALTAAGFPPGALTIIEAEHPASGIQLIRALRNGCTVVGYLDGNLGSGMQPQLLPIPFLAARIAVRIGLAWLAVRARVPFVGILCRRAGSGGVEWEARYLTDGSHNADPHPVAIRATEKLYRWLADEVAAEPWQWDHWFYLHENCHSILEK
jgi:lauroyl/myristoyl acyltransferase